MRALLMWLGVGAAAGSTHGIARWLSRDASAAPWLAGAISVLAVVFAVLLCGGLVARRRGQPTPLWFCAALIVLAALRGFGSGWCPPQPGIPAVHRGQAPAVWEAQVVEASRPGPRCTARVNLVTGREVRLGVPPHLCPLAAGDRLAVASQGVVWRSERSGARSVAAAKYAWIRRRSRTLGSGISRTGAMVRQRAWDRSRGDDGLAFVAASTLGVVVALPHQRRAELRRAGLGHLIAISGLHVGLAAALVLRTLGRLLAPLRFGRLAAHVLTWFPVLAFIWLTGFGPPAIRAAVMLLVVSAGGIAGRPTHGLATLILAAAAMLLYRPGWAFEPGFQMSIVAMAVLVRSPAGAGPILIAWRLGWAVMPVAWWHFGRVDGYGVLSNAAALPIFVAWVVPMSFIAALPGSIVPGLAEPCWRAASAGGELILSLAHVVSRFPSPPPWAWVLAAAVTLALRLAIPTLPGRRGGRWLPPRLAAVGLLGVGLVRSVPITPAPEPYWLATAPSRDPEVIVVEGQRVCVQEPRGTAATWRGRLRELGGSTLVLEPRLGDRERPDLQALRTGLADRVELPGKPCRFPSPQRVREALQACHRMGGTQVRGSLMGPTQCRLSATWRPLRLDS